MTTEDERLQIQLFRVLFDEERTRIDIDGDVMGWGAQFPDETCYVYWNRAAYAPEDRLEFPHVSVYGSIPDVEQGTGGLVELTHLQGLTRQWHDGTGDPEERADR